jgi:5-formyltetrahydrofolate cyclo-ligase
MHPGTLQTKAEWRRELLAVRAALPETTRRTASRNIATRVCTLSAFKRAPTILGYVPLGAEVDASMILAAATEQHKDTWVPAFAASASRPLWVRYAAGRIRDESGSGAEALAYPILAIVPGVGFDRFGMRLGRGGGFYDRALTALRNAGVIQVVGLAFEGQIVPLLPSDTWDEPVDLVASENRILAPSRGEPST